MFTPRLLTNCEGPGLASWHGNVPLPSHDYAIMLPATKPLATVVESNQKCLIILFRFEELKLSNLFESSQKLSNEIERFETNIKKML